MGREGGLYSGTTATEVPTNQEKSPLPEQGRLLGAGETGRRGDKEKYLTPARNGSAA
jgi:hypothetical protein